MTTNSKKPLKPDDFPVDVEGQKIKTQDGTPIADAESPAVADEIAERLNEDEARREEDKWSEPCDKFENSNPLELFLTPAPTIHLRLLPT